MEEVLLNSNGRTKNKHLAMLLAALEMGGMPNLRDMENTEVVPDENAKKITIPASMSKLEAAEELKKQHLNEEQVIEVRADFEGWNWKDVLVAIKKVSEETFGWINGITERTFFGTNRPKEIDVIVDIKNGNPITEKCFYGKFEIAGWEEAISNVHVQYGEAGIIVTCKKKYSDAVSKYFNDIRTHLANKSIYRGKTIVIKLGQDAAGHESTEFEIIENKGEEKIILNEEEEMVVDKFILGALNEAGKKCYLFTGDYGTGKTETAMRIGREAVKIGMTFFYCKESSVFDKFLNVSKRYQPCVVFLEDVDEIGSGEERDSRMNLILNTLDGVQTKGNDITVLFTTNHEGKINKALRRPGRIDMIVRFEYPTDETKLKIYQALMSDTNGVEDIDFEEVLKNTPHVQGAVLAQVCKRAKKLAEREGQIDTKGMLAALQSMKYQIAFMKDEVEAVNPDKLILDGLTSRIAEAIVNREEFQDIHTYVS